MHKGWHFTLNRDSMSFDSMNWKGLREYRRNDSRITLEVLQGERTKLSKMEAAREEVVPSMVDKVVERKMLGPTVVQRTKNIIDLIRGRLGVAQDGHKKYADLTMKGQREPWKWNSRQPESPTPDLGVLHSEPSVGVPSSDPRPVVPPVLAILPSPVLQLVPLQAIPPQA
ncbi:hypothetical protein AgCh_000544 [Apium graveolens]